VQELPVHHHEEAHERRQARGNALALELLLEDEVVELLPLRERLVDDREQVAPDAVPASGELVVKACGRLLLQLLAQELEHRADTTGRMTRAPGISRITKVFDRHAATIASDDEARHGHRRPQRHGALEASDWQGRATHDSVDRVDEKPVSGPRASHRAREKAAIFEWHAPATRKFLAPHHLR
jgi:hypothetical protein